MRTSAENPAVGQQSGLSAAKQALLAKWLRRGSPGGDPRASAGGIPRRNHDQPVPLSLEQQRLWFFHQMEPDSPLYTMPIASRLHGDLNPAALQKSLDLIVSRHESLRTRFNGNNPVQILQLPSTVPIAQFDLRTLPESNRETEAQRILEAEARRPFNLERDLMLRAALVRLAEREWVFLVLMHHIASDDWSWRIFCKELTVAYEAELDGRAPQLNPVALQYADFAAWQPEWLRNGALEQQLAYWRDRLAGAPSLLEIPADRPRPARQSLRGALEWRTLSPTLSERIHALGQRAGATPFTVLLCAFQTLLHRYTGRDDLLLGSPVAGRTRTGVESVVGLFVNLIVLRTDLAGDPPFSELLRRGKQTVFDALAHQDLPFEKLVQNLQPERSASHSPLVQVMFALQDELSGNLRLPGIEASPFALDTGTAKFDLTLTIVKSGANLNCCAEYNTDLFEPATIRRLLGHYGTLLEGIVETPDCRISELPLLDGRERNQLLIEWNRTEADYPRNKSVHQLFSETAAKKPDAVALICEECSMSYGELNRRANQLAHHLKMSGAGPGRLVAVGLERSMDLVVALLGILKCGAAYVPLDPNYPDERLKFMLEDSGTGWLLAGESLRGKWNRCRAPKVETIWLDSDWPTIAAGPHGDPAVHFDPEDIAYVNYTSGSTGRPKGVQIPHRALVNFLHSMRREPGLAETDKLLSVTSISFDIAGLEILLPLVVGARLVLADAHEVADAGRLAKLLERSGATIMQATPTLWRFLVESGWNGLPRLKILCGGESLSRDLARELLKRGAEVWNLYGPTETTIWSALAKVENETGPVPIGRPIANTQIYILDGAMQPVPIGVPGELYIGGDGLAHGYLNRPELTSEKFVANPLHSDDAAGSHGVACSLYSKEEPSPHLSPIRWERVPEGRVRVGAAAIPQPVLYRTGDIARFRADGNLECLGRADDQVKLRGHRIDPGEIESNLREFPGVREAVVAMRGNTPGDEQLVAYVVGLNGEAQAGNSFDQQEGDAALRGAGSGMPAGRRQHVQTQVPAQNELREFLKTKLPDYMVPTAFVFLDALPLTPNGKINRKALPPPDDAIPPRENSDSQPPRTPVEQRIAEIWSEVLKRDGVGIHDNFFDLGGHSVLAMMVMSRIRNSLGVELTIRDLFEAPTIAALAARFEQLRARSESAPIRRAKSIPQLQARELLNRLDELSDEEIESLLEQMPETEGKL